MTFRIGIYGPGPGDKNPTFASGAFRYLSITPHRTSKVISHPVEDGSSRFDDKVNDPFRVSVVGTVYSSDTATRNKIVEMVKTRKFAFYSINGFNNDYYDDVALVSASHRQSGESPDALEYTLEFQEIIIVKAQERPSTKVPDDQPTQKS